ncbi:hypothetical protein [Bradyrhizobium acaciae]|uniref:hypothetical protein n=1 Tax=Bradyrhizobium acaciae TaxID=2683706 RepID=UPI001E5AAE37|nr:hypothetical protein [Bradyrhizobium acaciae]MCC8978142.1 hypothetical protein [Bradyrhizobium acaciae]
MSPRQDAAANKESGPASGRPWTAAEKYKLRGLAKTNTPVEKIARSLNRSVTSTATTAARLGIVLNDPSGTLQSPSS